MWQRRGIVIYLLGIDFLFHLKKTLLIAAQAGYIETSIEFKLVNTNGLIYAICSPALRMKSIKIHKLSPKHNQEESENFRNYLLRPSYYFSILLG